MKYFLKVCVSKARFISNASFLEETTHLSFK